MLNFYTFYVNKLFLDRDIQHNISRSVINNNGQSGLMYMASGEVNPILTIEKNQFKSNCRKLYGNFTTCKSGLEIDVQNTQTIFFRVNSNLIISRNLLHQV